MHVGFNLLLALGLFLSFRNPLLRGFALLLPPAMILSTVVTGNHYLVDAPLGIMTAVTGLIIALLVSRYWPHIERRLPEWLRNLDGPPAEAGPVAQAR
jgi:membrane-associated phospholipid phosphatase